MDTTSLNFEDDNGHIEVTDLEVAISNLMNVLDKKNDTKSHFVYITSFRFHHNDQSMELIPLAYSNSLSKQLVKVLADNCEETIEETLIAIEQAHREVMN